MAEELKLGLTSFQVNAIVFLVCEQKTNIIKDNKPTAIFMFSQTMQDKMSRKIYHQKLLLLVDACTYQDEPTKITTLNTKQVNKMLNNEHNSENS